MHLTTRELVPLIMPAIDATSVPGACRQRYNILPNVNLFLLSDLDAAPFAHRSKVCSAGCNTLWPEVARMGTKLRYLRKLSYSPPQYNAQAHTLFAATESGRMAVEEKESRVSCRACWSNCTPTQDHCFSTSQCFRMQMFVSKRNTACNLEEFAALYCCRDVAQPHAVVAVG